MKLIIFVLFVTIACTHAQSCTQDYECGSNVPYRFCSGGLNECTTTIEGIAVDARYTYYAQTCRTTAQQPNITFKRISNLGSAPVNIYTQQVIPAPVNPTKILGVVGNTLFYDIAQRQPGVALRSLDIITGVISTINAIGAFPQPYFEFDTSSTSPNTYFCNYRISNGFANYTIERHNGITASGDFKSDQTLYVLPSAFACGPLRRYGANEIIFVDYRTEFVPPSSTITTTSFFRGTTSCVNCTLPTPFYTIQEAVTDISVTGSNIFFGTNTGLYRINLDGSSRVLVANEKVNYGLRSIGNTLFYNSGVNIKKVNSDGTNNVQLNSAPNGTCVCRPVFTGNQCQTCNGQVQWDYNGQPNCVPVNQYGVPASCNQDFQCGNAPYSACYSSTCTCRTNFSGPRCDVCAAPKQVTWDSYGYPTCA